MVNYPRIIQQLIQTKDDLIKDEIKISSALLTVRSIAKSLNDSVNFEWIDLELNGYHKFKTVGELEKNLPEYRITYCQFYDEYKRPIIIEDQKIKKDAQKYPVGQEISFIEEHIESYWILNPVNGQALREVFNVPVFQAHVPPAHLSRIISSVKSKLIEIIDEYINKCELIIKSSDDTQKPTKVQLGEEINIKDTNQNIVENFFSLAFHKLREIIFGEETFFKENPSLKSPIVIIRSSILLIFYLSVLALVTKGFSALLSFVGISKSNNVALLLTVLAVILYIIIYLVNKRKNGRKSNGGITK